MLWGQNQYGRRIRKTDYGSTLGTSGVRLLEVSRVVHGGRLKIGTVKPSFKSMLLSSTSK